MKLYGYRGNLHRRFSREKLSHSSLYRNVLGFVLLGYDSLIDESSCGFDLCREIRNSELSILESRNGFAELLSFSGVIDGFGKRALRDSESLRGNTDSSAVKRLERKLDAFADLTENVLLGDETVFEDKFARGGASYTHLLLFLSEGESREALLYEKRRAFDALGIPARNGDNHIKIRNARVRDEYLASVEDITVSALRKSSRSRLVVRVGTGVGFGKTERAQPFSARKLRKIFLLLLFRAVFDYRRAAKTRMRGKDNARRSAGFTEFFDSLNVHLVVAAESAVFLGNDYSEKPSLSHLLYVIVREMLGFVHFRGVGFDFVFGEIPYHFGKQFVFIAFFHTFSLLPR